MVVTPIIPTTVWGWPNRVYPPRFPAGRDCSVPCPHRAVFRKARECQLPQPPAMPATLAILPVSNRHSRISCSAVSELAHAVVAPSPHGPSLFKAKECKAPPAMAMTPVKPVTCTGYSSCSACRPPDSRPRCPPRPYGSVAFESEGVTPSRRYRCYIRYVQDLHRSHRVGIGAVAYLSPNVASPGPYRSVALHGERMEASRRDRDGVCKNLNRHKLVAPVNPAPIPNRFVAFQRH